ncbi:hypothetical protein [Methylobacterium currus]|uniref:hypothetical protein n=1 Tax=Methylobacterium currus TaxID=2051553 RepID=UPI000F5138BD|nr:hypothetical protein [Methylobacterium currus]
MRVFCFVEVDFVRQLTVLNGDRGARIAVCQDLARWPARAGRVILAFEHAIDVVRVEAPDEGLRLAAPDIPSAAITVRPA